MFFGDLVEPSFEFYQKRRVDLARSIKKENPDIENGLILLFASFENADVRFRQDSSFYYYTGIDQAGVAIIIDMNGVSTLFVPNCVQERKKWMGSAIEPTKKEAEHFNFDNIRVLGKEIKGFGIYPYFDKDSYESFLHVISDMLSKKGKIFVLNPKDTHQYVEQRFILDRIKSFVPVLHDENIIDISHVVTKMRRKKDIFEIGKIAEAISITAMAHGSAAQSIESGVLESEIQAAGEYIFIASCAVPAYPSIVAAGQNGTILHYCQNCSEVKAGDLIVVDLGAKIDHYCADLTRTYPASGRFSQRQKELYTIVLETQKYISDIAGPGYYLKNSDNKEKSLTHLALAFLKEKGGYDKYFTHGIGHFLGLDVHDVGMINGPLEEGDVITIEPGLYIPEEKIGIRIEDNYWIKKDKAICLSDMLPKEVDQIETFMKSGLIES